MLLVAGNGLLQLFQFSAQTAATSIDSAHELEDVAKGVAARLREFQFALQFCDLRFDLLALAQQARSPIGGAGLQSRACVCFACWSALFGNAKERLISVFGGQPVDVEIAATTKECSRKPSRNQMRSERLASRAAVVTDEDNVFRFGGDLLLQETFRNQEMV